MSTTLIITALTIGVVHTLLGPDHYLPFIFLSKTRGWSLRKTALITLVCAVGHIAGSVILGFAGIWFGINVLKLENIESMRGDIAAWALMAFGMAYFIWGLRKALKYNIENPTERAGTTAWVLFIIFALGPCEPLIPVLMYPAAENSGVFYTLLTAAVFGAATIMTMLAIVLGACYGFSFIKLKNVAKWSHASAGFAILACGFSMQFLGL
ncbi:MAG: hypothetical protein LBG46_05600 [Elusimicrobiota bacterium]|jgi:hypothetical protein|nr:hypothetical protein [Elusimicrobiota bacterium]